MDIDGRIKRFGMELACGIEQTINEASLAGGQQQNATAPAQGGM